MQGAAVLRGRCQGDQMRHGDLVGNVGAIDVGDRVERARLFQRAAVRRRIRGMRQPHAALDGLAQVVKHDQGRHCHRHNDHAEHQGLAMLKGLWRTSKHLHFASVALPVKDFNERAFACAPAF